MKLILFLMLYSFTLFGQMSMKEPWTIECGASTNTFFKTPASLNIRYITYPLSKGLRKEKGNCKGFNIDLEIRRELT